MASTENVTTPVSLSQSQHYRDVQQAVKLAVIISYLVTFVVGVTGNGMVCIVIGVFSQVRASSVHNYYIWNLSFADLFYTLTLPFYCYETYYSDWHFGDFSCKVAQVFKETNRFASVFTLVALSVDRYLASFYNLTRWRTTRVGVVVCFVIWIICGIISVPFWIYAQATPIPRRPGKHRCALMWPESQKTLIVPIWTYFQLVVGLILPFVVILVSYLLLAWNLHSLFLKSSARSSSQAGPGRKITRTVLVVVLVFVACQTPYYAVEMLALKFFESITHHGIMPTDRDKINFIILNTVAQILLFLSSCCNPVIYGLLNDNYRTYIYKKANVCSKQRVVAQLV